VSGQGLGSQFLLSDPGDYNVAIAQALRMFAGDVPNRRIVHYTTPATAFRFVLYGTGAILPPPAPALPVATPSGANGSTTYTYRVAARNAAGQGLWSQAVDITSRPATLTGGGSNVLTWAAVPGATSYDVFGRKSGQEALLRNTAALTYTDDGTDTPSGALGTGGLDAWSYDASSLDQVWMPYFGGASSSVQAQSPVDENDYRVVTEPGPLILLEFFSLASVAGQTLRLEFTSPHAVDEESVIYTTIAPKWVEAFQTLVAALLLRMVANRYLQNAGTTGLPNDVVDRRSQSDQAASRAKEYFALYSELVGGSDVGRAAASGFVDMDVLTQHNRGMLWKPSNIR
jgi:hypothetical protein